MQLNLNINGSILISLMQVFSLWLSSVSGNRYNVMNKLILNSALITYGAEGGVGRSPALVNPWMDLEMHTM